MTEASVKIGSLSAGVLGNLLTKLEIPVAAGALEEACRRTQSEANGPVDQLARVLAAVNRKNARAALLRWDRFDHRHMPVLLWHQETWWFAEIGDAGSIRLTDEAGNQENFTTEELADSLVLWVQVYGQSSPKRFITVNSPSVRLLLTEILRSKRWLAEVLVATLVVNVLAIAASLFSMQVYDRVVPSFAYATLWALVAGMVLVSIFDWVLKMIRTRILDSVAKDVDQRVSQQLFEHLLRLRLDTRPRSVGTMAAQVNGLESVRAFFSSSIIFALTDFPFALMFIAVIGIIGGAVGWVYFGLLVFAQIVGFLSQIRLRELSRLEIQRSHERHGMLVDSIQGAETIQSSGSEWRFAEQWRDITASIASYSLKSRWLTSITQTTAGTLGTVAYVCAIVVGVMEIEAGQLTMGGLIACTILGGRVLAPVAQGVQTLMQWQHVRESLQMVDSLLNLDKARSEDQDLLVPDTLNEHLQLEGVRFAYPTSPVLRLAINSLTFKAGERVAILGMNGCGKSTLLKVVAGLYRPSSGQIRLGGADIWELDPQILNEWVGYLPQDVHLFKGTLRSNMTVAGGISDAKVLEVARLLGIDRIVADSPRGMEMEISEGGQGLSGGQRQLVALSRIFLASPKIWLLDEPTASLDDEAELHVLEAFKNKVRHNDIMLITTHRPRLISLANRIIVMRGGQVVADGPPAEILKRLQQPRVPTAVNQ